ncbi:MAG: hypothetical protein GY861_15740 [bacterium]|nr:hypothetical protein [bacterium]
MDGVKERKHWAKTKVRAFKNGAKSLLELALQKKTVSFLIILALIFIIFFSEYVITSFFMLLFIALGTFSMLYNKVLKISLGIEFIMLGMVLSGLLFGPVPAIIVGLVSLFIAEVITERFTYSTFVSFIGICAIGFLTQFFRGPEPNVTATGIILTLIYDAIIIPGYLMLGSGFWRCMLFLSTHIVFNLWVFFTLAPPLHGFISSLI